jgi:hypothetical protein
MPNDQATAHRLIPRTTVPVTEPDRRVPASSIGISVAARFDPALGGGGRMKITGLSLDSVLDAS